MMDDSENARKLRCCVACVPPAALCTRRSSRLVYKHFGNHLGFTLIEIIIVLALIGLIATIILPTLRRSAKSEMMDGIHNLSSQIKLAYDDTIFTGRVHRMIFDVRNGKFWTEIAPREFSGRAPVVTAESESINKEKTKYFERFSEDAEHAQTLEEPILEIPVQNRAVLASTGGVCTNQQNCWASPSNKLISPEQFPTHLVFAQITTELAEEPLKFPFGVPPLQTASKAPEEKYLAYVYFFPDGTTTEASFQLGFREKNSWNLDMNALKYTLNLNIFTGQLKLLPGFQEVSF